MQTLLDVLVSFNQGLQNPIIDESLLKESALARILPFMPSNTGRKHSYRKYITEPTATHGNLNSGVSTQYTDWVVETTALDELEALQGYSKKLLAESQFNIWDEDAPIFVNSIIKTALDGLYRGSDASPLINFDGLKQIATKNSAVYSIASSSPANNTDALFAIKINSDKLSGVYNPTALNTGNGNVITGVIGRMPFNNAEGSYLGKDSSNNDIQMRGVLHTLQYGLVAKTSNHVAMLNGIGSAKKPTVADVLKILKSVKARLGTGTVYLIGNLDVLGYVDELKSAIMEMSPSDKNYSTYVTMFNGVEILPDENLTAQF